MAAPPGLHRQGRMEPFQRLNTRHLIQRDKVNTERMQKRSHPIQMADLLRFLGEESLVLWLGIQPAFAAMRT